MNLPSATELKRLAAACRKAGITHFKQGDFEITISEDAPAKVLKSTRSQAAATSEQGQVDSADAWDSFTETEKLFWSSGNEAINESEST